MIRRRELGYSQVMIAEELGVSQPTVSRWESGEIPLGYHWLVRLAELLKYPIGDLVEEVHTFNQGLKPGTEDQWLTATLAREEKHRQKVFDEFDRIAMRERVKRRVERGDFTGGEGA